MAARDCAASIQTLAKRAARSRPLRAARAVAPRRKPVTAPLFRFAFRVLAAAQSRAAFQRTAIMNDTETQPHASLYQRITDQIIAELERGVLPWHKPWNSQNLSGRVQLPLRYSGERYRGINVISLWMAAAAFGFTSPFWMTYRQAQELGGQVRKGEKGSLVVFTGTMTKQDESADDESDSRQIRFLRGYNVFNCCQIDGLPERFTERPVEPLLSAPARDAKAEAFFAKLAADVRHGGSRAYYAPKLDYIQMPPFETFADAASYYATRAHETMHWTSHEGRLNRSFEGSRRFGGDAYSMEELVAELGAAFLSVDLQLTAELRPDHASYLDHWLKVLKADNHAIFTAAAHAQRACDWLHARAAAGCG
jgi:antirestriction protein ArdC